MDALILERKPEEKTYDLIGRVDKLLSEQGFLIQTQVNHDSRMECWYESSGCGAVIAQYGIGKSPKVEVEIKNPQMKLEVDGILFFLGVPKEVYLNLNSTFKESY